MMMQRQCVCRKQSVFTPFIVYKNETVFKNYEGTVIGKCKNCGILKTFPSKKNKLFSPIITKSQDYEKRKQEFEGLFASIVSQIKKYVKPSATILDVGCSSGILLSLLKKRGFDVHGIEPNKQAYLFAKKKLKKNIFNVTLFDYSNNRIRQFDCIIYNHVLEHIQDINREFTLIHKCLKKNGILVIGVPNTDNVIFKIRKKYWESLLPNEHIWHFNTDYLKKYLKKQGYKISYTSFDDDHRKSYPVVKRIYFTLLTFLNKIMHTGEAVLIISQKC